MDRKHCCRVSAKISKFCLLEGKFLEYILFPGSVEHKKRAGRPTVRTPDANVSQQMENNSIL
jgi:hypothetical protein